MKIYATCIVHNYKKTYSFKIISFYLSDTIYKQLHALPKPPSYDLVMHAHQNHSNFASFDAFFDKKDLVTFLSLLCAQDQAKVIR